MEESLKNFNLLIDSMFNNEVKRFRNFLDRNFDLVNFQSPETGVSLLHYASHFNKPSFIKILIKNKADINLPDFSGETPLHAAADSNATEAITILLKEKKINPMKLDNKGRSALHYASHRKNLFAIKELIKQGCSIFQKDQLGWTPFLITIQNDDLESYSFLKEFIMGHENNIELSLLLLTHANNEGESGVHIASSRGAFSILKDFKKFYNKPTYQGKLPLQYAIERDRALTIVHMIKNGASPYLIGSNKLKMLDELWIAYMTHPNIKQNVFINKLLEADRYKIGLKDIGVDSVEEERAKAIQKIKPQTKIHYVPHDPLSLEFKNPNIISLQSAKIFVNSSKMPQNPLKDQTKRLIMDEFNIKKAIKNNEVDALKKVLQSNSEIFTYCSLGNKKESLWHLGYELGHFDFIELLNTHLIKTRDHLFLLAQDFQDGDDLSPFVKAIPNIIKIDTPRSFIHADRLIHVVSQAPNKTKLLKFLVGLQASILIKGDFGKLPIELALEQDNAEYVETLYPQYRRFRGHRDYLQPLLYAAKVNALKCIPVIMRLSPTLINVVDEFGWNALHYAFKYNNLEVVSLLAGFGVDLFYKDRAGSIPKDYLEDTRELL